MVLALIADMARKLIARGRATYRIVNGRWQEERFAAFVTETGGVSSHTVNVVRKYGNPAVMAVAGVTRIIEDGELILVDGSRGLVTRGKGARL